MRTTFFETWLVLAEARQPVKELDKLAGYAMKELARLEDYLDKPDPQRSLMDFVPRVLSRLVAYQFSRSQLQWIEELYLRVLESNSPGSTQVQEQLLELLAHARNPSSIPFWLKMVDYCPSCEDNFRKQRRIFTLAAIALIAVCRRNAQAVDALMKLSLHCEADVRELAIYYYGRVTACLESGLSEEWISRLKDAALYDPDFGPRYHARSILRQWSLLAPVDVNKVYTFCLRSMKPELKFSLTLQVLSSQTLESLHTTIVDVLGWEQGYLYSFVLSGEKDGYSSRNCCYYDVGLQEKADVSICDLGLAEGYKFLYLSGCDEAREIEITVQEISPIEDGMSYPRVTEKEGFPILQG